MHPWEGVVRVPAGRAGDYLIEHFTRPAGPVERSNMRTALCGGQADPPVEFDHETTWHRLSYSGGVWMTDLPIEQTQHDQELAPILSPDGGWCSADSLSVLVGGLGIGYAANVLARCPWVKRIVVVDRSPEVISLVKPHLLDPEGKIEVVEMDLFEYLKRNAAPNGVQEQFDFAFYDIWQSDGEGTFHNTVVPLRELSAVGDLVGEVICWNENVMRGQLAMALQSRIMATHIALLGRLSADGKREPLTLSYLATPCGSVYHDWACPFFEAVLARQVPGVTPTDTDGTLNLSAEFMRAAGAYASVYGKAGWQSWWAAVRTGTVKL